MQSYWVYGASPTEGQRTGGSMGGGSFSGGGGYSGGGSYSRGGGGYSGSTSSRGGGCRKSSDGEGGKGCGDDVGSAWLIIVICFLAVSGVMGLVKKELIRNADGTTTNRAEPALLARTGEGDGLVLVTLAVAARGELYDVHTADDAEEVRRALEGMSSISDYRLVAVEVVWTPAAEDDRMSSVELEVLYPFMRRLPEARAGRVSCNYCAGTYPAELLSCPHCGGVAVAG